MEDHINEQNFLSLFLEEGIYVVEQKTEKAEESVEETIIVEPNEEEQHEEESLEESKLLDHFGNNKKSFAFLLDYECEEHISIKDKLVLDRVIAAVNLTYEDIAIINLSKYNIHQFNDLHNLLQNKYYIGFKLSSNFRMEYPQNELQKLQDATLIFLDFSIAEMAMSKEQKMILWKSLKEIFGL